jgi:hypothetical protein
MLDALVSSRIGMAWLAFAFVRADSDLKADIRVRDFKGPHRVASHRSLTDEHLLTLLRRIRPFAAMSRRWSRKGQCPLCGS